MQRTVTRDAILEALALERKAQALGVDIEREIEKIVEKLKHGDKTR
jgi:hypothetical protein